MGVLNVAKGILKRILRKDYKYDWKKIEYFNTDWKNRIEIMAQFIQDGDSILDLGCGQMWLKEYIPKNCVYIPVDYQKRDSETIICDFNKNEFPELKVNVAFVSGCFEYVNDYTQFVNSIKRFCDKVVISYVSTDIEPDIYKRKKNAWCNHLNKSQFLKVFVRNGFVLDRTVSDGKFVIYHFIKLPKF